MASFTRGVTLRRIGRGLAVMTAGLMLCGVSASWAESPKAKSGSLGTAPKSGYFTPSIMPGFEARLAKSGTLLSTNDRAAFEDAYDAANRRDWGRAQMAATRIRNKTASKLIIWAYLTAEETRPSFDELVRFLDANPNWPLQTDLLEKAERALPESMPPTRLVAWFAGQEPLTGAGILRLGEALLANGDKEYGSRWIILAWSLHDFTDAEQSRLFSAYYSFLKGQPTIDRVDHLLWSGQSGQAEKLLSELPDDKLRIARARIALIKQASDGLALAKALPKSLESDPGVIFDSARYLRRMDRHQEARAVLMTLKDPDKAPFPEKWWIERSYQAREALNEREYPDAYALLANTGLKEGSSYADAEWLAGWVALRYLNRPSAALQHFQKLETSVSFPISLARAHYWTGRAAEAISNTTLAAKAYTDAAKFPYTYYGQLGASSGLLSNQKLSLPPTPTVPQEQWASFLNDELVMAIRLLREIEGDRYVRTLAYALVDRAKTPEDLVLIAELCRSIGQTAIAVRVAKRASQQHARLLTDYLYPVIPLPAFIGGGAPPEPALVLGLARQESEFNPRAVSSANARGMMQIIPSTARMTANRNGIPYREAALVDDADYNMQIGMAHLSDLLEHYNGSYILVAAAYNAGSANVDKWIRQMGDPRSPSIDPIDWIEAIPFSETRNYVQRVLENVVDYRQRIADRPINFTIATDLRRTSATPIDLSYLDKAPGKTEAAQAKPDLPPAKPPQVMSPDAATPTAPTSSAPETQAPGSIGTQPSAVPAGPEAQPMDAEGTTGALPTPGAPEPDTGLTGTPMATRGLVDRNYNIPAECKRFVVHPDRTAECID